MNRTEQWNFEREIKRGVKVTKRGVMISNSVLAALCLFAWHQFAALRDTRCHCARDAVGGIGAAAVTNTFDMRIRERETP